MARNTTHTLVSRYYCIDTICQMYKCPWRSRCCCRQMFRNLQPNSATRFRTNCFVKEIFWLRELKSSPYDLLCFFPTGLSISTPSFNRTSFIAYQTIPSANEQVQISMMFKPRRLADSLLLYNAFSNDGNGDYIALALKDQYVEFRYDSGSGSDCYNYMSSRS